MVIVKVPENREDEMLQKFCDSSAFTLECVDISSKEGKKSLEELEKVARKTGFGEKDFVVYTFKGNVMNRCYGLTESNAYPENCTFAVIPGYYDFGVKQVVGARWFDDIVANNVIKQHAIETGLEPDFDIKTQEEN